MTLVVPLSVFLILILEFLFNSLIAMRSLYGKLCFGFESCMSASSTLTSSRNVSRATDMAAFAEPRLISHRRGAVHYLALIR